MELWEDTYNFYICWRAIARGVYHHDQLSYFLNHRAPNMRRLARAA